MIGKQLPVSLYDGNILRARIPGDGPEIILSLKNSGNLGYSEQGAFLNRLGIDEKRFIRCRQIHSKKIFVVDSKPPHILSGDGLITENSALILGATAADCMPIYFFDSKNKVFGIVHSGWKGTGIIAEAAGILQDRWGTVTGYLTVVLGPSAGVCCYEVDETRYRIFTSRWGEKSGEKRNGKYYLNLKSANYDLLYSLGIHNVYDFHECTICNEKYGSYRRQGPENFTRMLALIGYFG